jgi:HK97 family phage portal protein
LPESPLLKKPYAEISRRDWWIGFIWALALRGNFYGLIIERGDNGFPVQIKPIHNDAVQIFRDRTTGRLIYRFYGEEVPYQNVMHVRYQTMPGEIIGLNPIQLLSLTFGNAIAKERFVESFYLNSANPMGVIQVPGYLERKEVRKMIRSWIAAHQGLSKANLPAVLTEGAEFKPITISPLDSQLLEALQFSDSQICGRIFRVPPHMVGMTERGMVGGRGIEQLERQFFANTLVGYLEIGMEALTTCHPAGQYVHFNTTARTRGATLERAQAGALGMNSGFFVADEVRDWFDLAPLPDGNGQYTYSPINTQLLDQALLTLKQMKAMPPPSTDSGAPPRPGMPPKPGNLPVRKPSPNGIQRGENGNGNGEMTVEEAWFIVQSAVAQAKRMEYSAQLAMRLRQDEEE